MYDELQMLFERSSVLQFADVYVDFFSAKYSLALPFILLVVCSTGNNHYVLNYFWL